MRELQFFDFENASVRVHIDNDGEPWFVAKDGAAVLEIQNASDAVHKTLDRDEWGIESIYTPACEQRMLIVSESGLYALIFKSRKPQAKKFRKWATSEVLPSIRRTGGYGEVPPSLREEQSEYAESCRTMLEAVALLQSAIAECRHA